MKFYNSIGPNPRVVTMFMAEKGIEIPTVTVDLRGGENRRAPITRTSIRQGRRPHWNSTTARPSPKSPRSANIWKSASPIRC